MSIRHSIVAIAALSTLGLAVTPAGAFANDRGFDGNWSVEIITSRGACSSDVRFNIEVRDGAVFATGLDVRGKVAANGATQVRIASGNQSASGSGRLAGNSGAGTWQGVGSQGACAGKWSAIRA
jgi:hypothetical protein